LSEERAKDIGEYLSAGDGSIPTNIVLSAQKAAGLKYTAMAFINNGGTQFPICLIPSSNFPEKMKPSGKDPKCLNSARENRLF
jgi:hypothetical protein